MMPVLTDDLTGLVNVLTSQGGVVAILVIILYALGKGWWAPKAVVDDKDRQIAMWQSMADRWMNLALKSTNLATLASGLPVDDTETKTKAP